MPATTGTHAHPCKHKYFCRRRLRVHHSEQLLNLKPSRYFRYPRETCRGKPRLRRLYRWPSAGSGFPPPPRSTPCGRSPPGSNLGLGFQGAPLPGVKPSKRKKFEQLPKLKRRLEVGTTPWETFLYGDDRLDSRLRTVDRPLIST